MGGSESERALQTRLAEHCAEVVRQNCRLLIVLSGSRAWGQRVAAAFVNQQCADTVIWLGPLAPQGALTMDHIKPSYLIGRECQHAVMEAHDAFIVDVFAALSGTVRGGGLMFLLVPTWEHWQSMGGQGQDKTHSLFLQRFKRHAENHHGVVVFGEKRPLPAYTPAVTDTPPAPIAVGDFATPDQELAVLAINRVAHGHRRRPAVLIADRGRGKSAALGIAAAQLLRGGVTSVIVTGPGMDCAASVFKHARALLPDAVGGPGQLHHGAGSMRYLAPDKLLEQYTPAHLLLVDEAAALPVAILEQLLRCYSRIVFATTVHGYEGTGMGFARHFFRYLDQETPGWQRLQMQMPVRWRPQDPLEQFSFNALLMNATYQMPVLPTGIPPANIQWQLLEPRNLAENEAELRQLFGLLVLAHYRTRPSDLQSLLDDQDIRILALRQGALIVSVCLLRLETPIPVDLLSRVYRGQRRVQGRITAQILVAQLGVAAAGELGYARIMRIAVLPELQRRGLGAHLVQAARQWAETTAFSTLSVSYSAAPELVSFWERQGFIAVYLGLSKDHVSGSHSLCMLLPGHDAATQVVSAAQQRLSGLLDALICRELNEVTPDLWCSLVRQLHARSPIPQWRPDELMELDAFINGARSIEISQPLVKRLLEVFIATRSWGTALTPRERDLLVAKVVKGKTWSWIKDELAYAGKSAAITGLRCAVGKMARSLELPSLKAPVDDLEVMFDPLPAPGITGRDPQ